MLSPIFQVRHFDVKELYPFRVNIEFEKDDGPVTNLLFGAKVNEGVTTQQFLPSIKNVAFMKTDPFSVKVVYDKDCDIGGVRTKHPLHACMSYHLGTVRSGSLARHCRTPFFLVTGFQNRTAAHTSPERLRTIHVHSAAAAYAGDDAVGAAAQVHTLEVKKRVLQASRNIADFKVTVPHKVPEGATSVSCKVSFELDLHGLVRCTQATHCHKIEVTEDPPAPAAAPKADAAAPADASAAGEGAAKAEGENGDASNMDTDAPVGPPKPEDAKPAPVKKLKKV